MKALVVSTNRHRDPTPVMPFGACLVAEAAERAGHEAVLLDMMFERDPLQALERAVSRERPDVIGLSLRNLDSNDMAAPIPLYEELLPIMRLLRAMTRAPVALGGAGAAVMPEQLLRYTGAECVALGDGETIFPPLIEALAGGDGLRGVPGVAWLEDGQLARSGVACEMAMDACRVPDYSRWLNARAYTARFATAPLQTKRGCPFHCVYCTYAALEGRGYRLCPPQSVAGAARDLVAAGFRDVEFVDNVFNAPPEHALAVCESLALNPTRARFQTLELSPRLLGDDLLKAMLAAGFVGAGITAESASDAVLSRMRKEYSVQDLHAAAVAVRRHKLPVLWVFLFGGPGETRETVEETLRFAERETRAEDTLFFTCGLRVYPGTELEEIARREGRLDVPAEEMLKPVFYVSPGVERRWLEERLRKFSAAHLNCINMRSIGLGVMPAIRRIGSALGASPPLWRHTRMLRRVLRPLGLDGY